MQNSRLEKLITDQSKQLTSRFSNRWNSTGHHLKVYRAQPTRPTPSPLHLAFNFDAKNPELAEIFSNQEFRAAMEYALDRERIIEEVYNTLAVLGGVPVLPANKAFYNPEIENIRRAHDADKAEEILDSPGTRRQKRRRMERF